MFLKNNFTKSVILSNCFITFDIMKKILFVKIEKYGLST